MNVHAALGMAIPFGRHLPNGVIPLALAQAADGADVAFGQLCNGNRFLFENYTHLSFIGYPFMFLWGPTFYLYIAGFTFSDFRLKWRHLLHAVPFIAAAAYLAAADGK